MIFPFLFTFRIILCEFPWIILSLLSELSFVKRNSMENADILTEIGILYLRVNDTKGAFDKLFEVTKLHENCSKALLALGSILQVRFYLITLFDYSFNKNRTLK